MHVPLQQCHSLVMTAGLGGLLSVHLGTGIGSTLLVWENSHSFYRGEPAPQHQPRNHVQDASGPQ